MVKVFLFIGGLLIGQISYKVIHGYDCQYVADQELVLLKKQSQVKDSLLYLWFNNYTFHIRVIAGVEKDSAVTRYQLWNHKCVGLRKKKK
jgi:hypothetical protein